MGKVGLSFVFLLLGVGWLLGGYVTLCNYPLLYSTIPMGIGFGHVLFSVYVMLNKILGREEKWVK